MTIFQILAALFALFMLYIVSIHKKKAALSPMEVGFWYGIWVVFIVISLFPNLLLGVVNIFHFARVFDLLTVLAFMVLTVVIILTYFAQRESTKKIEDYIRKKAITQAKK
jgi:hypothetical protein